MATRAHTTTPRASWRARTTSAAVGLLVLLALAMAPPAMAKEPTGEFAVFRDCPLETTGVNYCVYVQATSGEVVIGRRSYPIAHTIMLQGGLKVAGKEEAFVGARDGNTLSKTEERVPGGFPPFGTELPPPYREFFKEGSKELTATLELASPASEAVAIDRSNLAAGKGTAVKLVTRLHLNNLYLGKECFFGSKSSPISLNLTTGTTSPPPPNKSIKGSPGKHESKEGGTLGIYNGDSLVENAFSVSSAEGCGGLFSFLIDPLLNAEWGLPAAAGRNTVILNGTSEFATAEAVRKSEK